jgi:prolyl 4-hydroxylase
LNSFFEHLLAESSAFHPTVYSIPSELLEAARKVPLVTIAPTVASLGDGPWVITLENFFDASECKHLIEQGHAKGYERSTDVGGIKADGTFDKVESTRRTSTNTWCSGDCYHDTVVQDMTKKLEALLHVPTNYTEHWQLLRYEVGQEYKEHHDFVRQQVTRAEGPRIFTVFFYLNTVTDGGGTQFPALNNLTIYPERGRVLIWPSVLDANPDEPDTRTNHLAMPVGDGVKYGANAWIHQRDYKTPQSQFCV